MSAIKSFNSPEKGTVLSDRRAMQVCSKYSFVSGSKKYSPRARDKNSATQTYN